MYRIALCDKDKSFCEAQKNLCREILKRHNIEHSIAVYCNDEDFCKALSGGKRYDLILMETVMFKINGIEIARRIRETDRDAVIIFITSSRDYAIEGYEVGAFRYLIKPVNADVLNRLIPMIYKDRIQTRYFIWENSNKTHRVAKSDIISMKTVNRKVEITMSNSRKVLYFPGKLTELLAKLSDKCFLRCHQSHAVNIENIRELSKTGAVTKSGKKIPISRRYRKDVENALYR